MATTLNIQRFIRSVRQGRTPSPVSCTAMAACTQQAYNALLAASWMRVDGLASGLPRHNWAQTGFSNRWDASKYCGDYANGYQHGYATAVCYTIRMPADALAGTVANIVSLAIPAHGDRWLADGCDIGVTLSASATPPAWEAAPDDAVTGQLAVVPSNTGTDTSAIVTFDWSAAPKTTLAYLHITLRLTNYLTHRGAWIEGSAMIDGAAVAVEFDRDVTPDTDTAFDDPLTAFVLHPPPSVAAGRAPVHFAMTANPVAGIWRQMLNNHHVLQAPMAHPGGSVLAGAYLIRSSSEIMAVSSYTIFSFFSTGGAKFDAVKVDDFLATAVAPYVSVRMVFYGVSSGAFNLTASEWISKLDTDTITPGSFWRGSSTSVTAKYVDDSTAVLPVTLLADIVVPPGGMIGPDYVPLSAPWTPAGDAAVIACFSVHDMIAAPPTTPDTPYGWVSINGFDFAMLRRSAD